EEQRYFNVVMEPTYQPDGMVDGVMLFTVDVTEAVRSRQRVEELLAERNAILGQIAEGLVIVDARHRITFTNETAQALLGMDVTGMDLSTFATTLHLAAREGQPAFESGLGVDHALESREVTPLDFRIRRPDGMELIIQGSAAPVTGENGAQLGAVVTFRDVTAQQTLERQKDDFLAAAAHDLKTPLTTVKGIAQILQRRVGRWDTPEAESLLEDLSRIDATATRMAILINKLLDLTRLQMDQPLDLDKRPTGVVALARSMIAEQQISGAPHRVRLESDGPEIVGVWDAFRLERVISNLLSNAIRYSPEGGEITISIQRLEEAGRSWVEIIVRDQGIGIPAKDLPHIFERFFRASNVVGQIAGVGIGLSGVRQIVEQHGGSIAAESQEGIGTTFTVRLPLED
ncbi:MAG TPA: PAS domain-containing sensor histidine kinase, partial [Chloroflexota bacterium]